MQSTWPLTVAGAFVIWIFGAVAPFLAMAGLVVMGTSGDWTEHNVAPLFYAAAGWGFLACPIFLFFLLTLIRLNVGKAVSAMMAGGAAGALALAAIGMVINLREQAALLTEMSCLTHGVILGLLCGLVFPRTNQGAPDV